MCGWQRYPRNWLCRLRATLLGLVVCWNWRYFVRAITSMYMYMTLTLWVFGPSFFFFLMNQHQCVKGVSDSLYVSHTHTHTHTHTHASTHACARNLRLGLKIDLHGTSASRDIWLCELYTVSCEWWLHSGHLGWCYANKFFFGMLSLCAALE